MEHSLFSPTKAIFWTWVGRRSDMWGGGVEKVDFPKIGFSQILKGQFDAEFYSEQLCKIHLGPRKFLRLTKQFMKVAIW
jgi:hypothetical protein